MIYLWLFLILSVLLLGFTLHRPYRHRFPRFFVFESVLGLVILNADSWFRDPASPLQIVSWLLLFVSLLLAWHAFRQLRLYGAPQDDVENTIRLVDVGAYAYIRHPLYCSLLLFGIGAFLKSSSMTGFLLLLVLCVSVTITGRVEEKENLERFGEAYVAYMQTTRMFIPFIL